MGIAVAGPAILDINTQRDLIYPDGAYVMHEAPALLDPLKRLFTWAARRRCPVVSTRLRNALMPGRRSNEPICIPDSEGYRKIPVSLMRRRLEMPSDCGTSLPIDGFATTQQFIFDLPGLNPFELPRLDRLLSEAEVETWLIVGGPLEGTVRMAVLGLLQRRHKVIMVRDCTGQRDPYEGEMALRQIESKNIEFLSAEEVAARYSSKPRQGLMAASRSARTTASHPAGDTPARTRKARRMRLTDQRTPANDQRSLRA